MEEWGLKPIEQEEYKYKKPKFDLFKIIYSCIKKDYNPSLEEKQKIPEYIFHNFFTGNKKTIDLALQLDTRNIPIEKQYDLVRYILPKNFWIPYPKKNKVNEDELIKVIANYYNENYTNAKQYYNLIKKNKKALKFFKSLLPKEGR